MIKYTSALLFLLGAALVVWVAAGFFGSHALAFWVTLAIAGFYVVGFVEQVRFQSETARLEAALTAADRPVEHLDGWVGQLPGGLQTPVRLRIQGEPVSLPMPVLTPYLTSLLVMLGLLGTFVGMVISLQGAATALEASTELAAIRQGLTAPIAGLSMAFGTSVAGVAASAVLGLISVLSRRQRLAAVRLLDSRMTTAFAAHSRRHYQDQMLEHARVQASQLPEVVAQLGSLTERLDGFVSALDGRLVSGQEQFHERLLALQSEMTRSVGAALQDSLTRSGREVGESVRPVLTEVVESLARDAGETQQQLRAAASAQATAFEQHLTEVTRSVQGLWQSGTETQQRLNGELLERIDGALQASSRHFTADTERLVASVDDLVRQASAAREAEHAIQAELASLVAGLEQVSCSVEQGAARQGEWLAESAADTRQQAETVARALTESSDRLSELLAAGQQSLAGQLADTHRTLAGEVEAALKASISRHGRDTVELLQPLLERALAGMEASAVQTGQSLAATAREQLEALSAQLAGTSREVLGAVDRVSADAVGGLQHNRALLEQHRALLASVSGLTGALEQDAARYRAVIDELAAGSARTLAEASTRFDEQLGAGSRQLVDAADHFSASAIELATLGESMAEAVARFETAGSQLHDTLTRVEQAMGDAAGRSDEQLAYYVAQAREVIDHSVSAQQQLIEQVRQISAAHASGG